MVRTPNKTRAVQARVANQAERSRLWSKLDGGPWGDIEGYAVRRSRETPIVVLEPRVQ